MAEKKTITEQNKDYGKYIGRKHAFLLILLITACFVGLLGISVGSSGMPLKDVFSTIMGKGTKQQAVILFNLRLPRACTAMVGGFALGMVGCVMQGVLRNPLAEASTIGVSQGAAFGAAFAIIVLGAGVESTTSDKIVNISNPYLVSTCAFLGAMLSTLIIIGIARLHKMSSGTLILAGVAIGSMFSGITTLIEYFADDVKVAAVVYWTFGNLGGTYWKDIVIMLMITAVGSIYFFMNRWNFNAILSGEETAKSLGVKTDTLLFVSMTVCALTSAAVVANIGIIGFVGLIAPHMVRRFIGQDYRFLLPASGLGGAILLLVGDIAARMIVAPVVLPIGAITSFVGAPMFLYIIFREESAK